MQIAIDVRHSSPSTDGQIGIEDAQESFGQLVIEFSDSRPYTYEGPSIVLILNELEMCFERVLRESELQPILVLFAPIALMVRQGGRLLISTGSSDNFHEKIIDETPIEDVEKTLRMLTRLVDKHGRIERG